jgi:Ca2+-binding EF-hand superfamily protein
MQKGIWLAIALTGLCCPLRASDDNDTPGAELDDPRVRILICTPQGPLIVQLSLTVDGRPYRHAAENLIDRRFEVLATADSEPAWTELFEHPQFRADWSPVINTSEKRTKLVTECDTNRDGRIARHEFRQAFLRVLGRNVLQLVRGPLPPDLNQELLAVIDVDGNGRLSREEMDMAGERIARLDVSGDGTIAGSELMMPVLRAPRRPATDGTLLERTLDRAPVGALLREHYADADGRIPRRAFRIAPDLFERLDRNRDGELREDEFQHIGSLPPQITLASDMPDASIHNPVFVVKGTSPGLIADAVAGSHAGMFHRWQSGRSRVDIHGLSGSQGTLVQRAGSLFRTYDRNGNGYLELFESDSSDDSQFAPWQFAGWDADGNGRIFPDELRTVFEREGALARCSFRISLTCPPPPLWTLLDNNRDGTLGTRESRSIRQLLAEFDADHDGEIASDEMPFQFVVQIARSDRETPWTPTSETGLLAGQSPRGPKWFRAMDANRDGDVSQQEFLGTAGQFERLDADHDGLIDRRESEAATP